MKRLAAVFVILLAAACGKDDPGLDIPCTSDELYDHVSGDCVPRGRDEMPQDAGDADAGNDDGGNDQPDGSDEPDMSVEPDLGPTDPACDRDRDGALSMECGGDDCDDDDISRSPRLPEFCDDVDNNCNGVNNEGLRCNFYAHSGRELYVIDPFELTATQIGMDLPNLQDIDTHPNGTLLGVTFDGLWEYDDIRDSWWHVGDFGRNVPDPNGFAIDSAGTAFVTGQDRIYSIDVIDGGATELGVLGADYYSSGDCVVNKRDSLYMTSKHDPDQDHLLLVNRMSGSAMEVGPIGFRQVFGLTAAWGLLYGLTRDGELIVIDTQSGAGTLLHKFEGISFFGAASTPDR